MLSFPAILVALILLAMLGKGVDKVAASRSSSCSGPTSRGAARGAALVERTKEYVEAAHVPGAAGWPRIVLRHMLPNCMPPLIVIATIDAGARHRARSRRCRSSASACR